MEFVFQFREITPDRSRDCVVPTAVKNDHLDVIAIGRSSVDLYGQQIGSRLEDVTSFAKSVGGCPANISVGTARLGLR